MLVISPLLSECFKEALQRSPEMLGRCMDDAVTALKALASEGREVVVHDAESRVWWVLLQNKAAWGEAYAERLQEAFTAHELGQGDDKALQFHAPPHELAVEDEHAVNEWLEAAQWLQQLQTSVEQDLAALDARLSTLGGPGQLHVEKTPLRPSVFMGVLRDLMASLENSPETRATWLRHLAPTLGLELRSLYQHLAFQLQRASRDKASYRVRLVEAPQPGPMPRRHLLGDESGLVGQPKSSQNNPEERKRFKLPSMSALACAQSAVSQPVMQAFFRHGGTPFERALSPAYFERVERELALLDEPEPVPVLSEVVDPLLAQLNASRHRLARHVDIDSRLPQEHWGLLADPRERARVVLQAKQAAERVAQVLGIDLVRRLVNQVARDPLLLAPVREAVVALEPALVRLAVVHPRFFSEAGHPARRLVESVAQRSFQFNDEFSAEFASFIQPVRAAINRLNAADTTEPKPFADAFAALQSLWEKQGQRQEAVTDQRLRVLRFADERQALADHFKRELQQRPDLEEVPPFILEFLERIWSLVVASARLTNPAGGDDPGDYRAAAARLLWCGRPEVLQRRPEQVLELLPDLLRTLHAGLDSLNMSRKATRPFFEALNLLHEPVLGSRRVVVRRGDEDSSLAPLEAAPTPAAPPVEATRPPAPVVAPVGAPSSPPSRLVAEVPPAPVLPPAPMSTPPSPAVPHDEPAEHFAVASSPVPLPESEEPWLDRSELHTAGFEEPPPTDYGALVNLPVSGGDANPPDEESDEAPVAAPGAPMSDQEAEAILNQIRVGDWIDLCSHGEWLRAQLIWASARATLFMFTSSSGRAHSMSRRSCIKLVRRRWLLPVNAHPVVQVAMQAIGAAPEGTPPAKPGH